MSKSLEKAQKVAELAKERVGLLERLAGVVNEMASVAEQAVGRSDGRNTQRNRRKT